MEVASTEELACSIAMPPRIYLRLIECVLDHMLDTDFETFIGSLTSQCTWPRLSQ